MTLLQEAYFLMQEQPEKNIKLIVELLQTMSPKKDKTSHASGENFKRTGLARGVINLPDDFDEVFDELDKEISELFYGDVL